MGGKPLSTQGSTAKEESSRKGNKWKSEATTSTWPFAGDAGPTGGLKALAKEVFLSSLNESIGNNYLDNQVVAHDCGLRQNKNLDYA